MRYVSLFSGAGGLDAGLAAIGGQCVCAIEMDADSCKTLRLNGHKNVIQAPIEAINPRSLREGLGIRQGEIDLVVGGPPCQPFSKSALWTKKAAQGLSDRRSETLFHFFEYLTEFQPRAFLLENVEGFSKFGGLEYVERSLDGMQQIGLFYSFSSDLIDASIYGVPQRRRRFIAVGIRDRISLVFPAPKYGLESRHLTAWDALSALATANELNEDLNVQGRWAALLNSIPPGANYLWHTDRGGGVPLFGWRTRFWSFLLKLDPHLPSPTIVASPSQNSGPFHWENRLLSTPEMAAIQTFSQNYSFVGNRASRQRQIGNAVPPLLSGTIGISIAKHLECSFVPLAPLKVRRSRKAPKIPELGPVSPKYHALIGSHAPHPGTGKGPHPRGSADLNPAQSARAMQAAWTASKFHEMMEA